MTKSRFILLILHGVSLVLLFFGWTCDMLKIEISTQFIFKFNLFNEKRSVLGTLESLWESANYFPFALIFLFGLLIPIIKSVIIFYLLIASRPNPKYYYLVSAINKWAMADVFAISIFVAFLGANAMKNTEAILESGFYFFAGYVLLGGLLMMLMRKAILTYTG